MSVFVVLNHQQVQKRFPNKEAKLLVACSNGTKYSLDVLETLDGAGYVNLVGLKGGYQAWFRCAGLGSCMWTMHGMLGELTGRVCMQYMNVAVQQTRLSPQACFKTRKIPRMFLIQDSYDA